jgi:hypothetical protein
MNAASPPPRLAALENLRWVVRFRLFATMLFVASIYGWKFWRLQRSLKPAEWFLTQDDRRTLKLRRRFIAGAAAGYVASTESLSQPFLARTNFIYADLGAFWSNWLIAADATMDQEALSLPEVRRLFAESLTAMLMKVEADLPIDIQRRLRSHFGAMFGNDVSEHDQLPVGPHFRLRRYTLQMAAAIGDRISSLVALHGARPLANALDQFYSRTLDLMAAQLETYDQSIVDDEHDFGWYRSLMHRKFMNVLLAPIALFANPAAGLYPEAEVRLAFHLLNRNFFHRQILDDLIDFDEDLADNFANALIYILVSQGRLASIVANSGGCTDEALIVRELERSGLLAHPAKGLDDQLLPDSDREPDSVPQTINLLVRNALKNGPDDASVPLEDLVDACLRRRAALYEAWAKRDHAAVKAIVTRSGVANRILNAIAEGTDQRQIEDALKRCMERSNIQGGVYTYYTRTLRTYEKCVSKWQPRAVLVARPAHEPV